MTLTNRKFLLAARPVGMPKRSDWAYVEEPVGEPKEGELLVKVLYISLDPAMRMWINDARSYMPPVGIGELMRALGLGVVSASRNPRFAVGDHVSGLLGMQEYALSDGRGIAKIDLKAALPKYLSVFGMPGMTAYFGLLETGQPKPGEMVVVSAAAGAVGTIVGQIAKIKGCHVVGIAGGPEKCGYIVRDLGFNAAIDYKSEDVKQSLRKHCPEGIDVYFDNVGGAILDAALTQIRRGARIVICGAISQYNETQVRGPANYMMLLVARASMTGMLVFDYEDRYPEALAELSGWLRDGSLVSREHVVRGSVHDFPETLLMLFDGANTGKLVLALETE